MTTRVLKFTFAALLMLNLTGSGPFAAQESLPVPDKDLPSLIATLNSDAQTMDKAMACQQLAIIGDLTAVPMLVELLNDRELSTHARTALENIQGADVDEALRASCRKLVGGNLLGAIQSLGKRQNSDSIPVLEQYLVSEDPAVRLVAARAIAEIGTPESIPILLTAISNASGDFQVRLGGISMICVQRLVERGEKQGAIALCQRLLESSVPESMKQIAAIQLIHVSGDQGVVELQRMLVSEDAEEFELALYAARRQPGKPDFSVALATMLASEKPQRQVLLLKLLSEQIDGQSLPVILQVGKSGNVDVQVAALKAIARVGDNTAADWLFESLSADEPRVVGAAVKAVVALEDANLDAQVIKLLESTDNQTVLSAIEVVAGRRLESSFDQLSRLDVHPNLQVRQLAIHAMGQVATAGQLEPLIERMIESSGNSSLDGVNQALRSACLRMPRKFCTRTLASALETAPKESKIRLLEQLANIGGPEALGVVVAAAKNKNDAMQDAATRVLGEWLTADAAPAIFDLARSSTNGKYRTRMLRGYIRIARQLSMTMDDRMDVCRNALRIADRNEEKMLVLDVLGRHRSYEGMALAQSMVNEQGLSEKASSVVQQIHNDLGEEPETGFVSLFDGRTLKGWKGGDLSFWRVEDDAIVGGDLVDPVKQNEFLRTTRQYGDFELRLQFKLAGAKANAGVQIRTAEIPNHHEVSGYQADLGDGWWGCLYDESRRNKVLAGPPAEERSKPVRLGRWNDYRIVCNGKRVQLWINGLPTVDYTEPDAEIPQAGIIALQVHGGEKMEARYRNIRIKVFD